MDEERAAAGPFGGTIAHGYLTLSLIPMLSTRIFAVDTPGARLNYGLNKVRFPMPVRVGARVRGRASLVSLADVPAGKQLTVAYTIEVEGESKPACVAETVVAVAGVSRSPLLVWRPRAYQPGSGLVAARSTTRAPPAPPHARPPSPRTRDF